MKSIFKYPFPIRLWWLREMGVKWNSKCCQSYSSLCIKAFWGVFTSNRRYILSQHEGMYEFPDTGLCLRHFTSSCSFWQIGSQRHPFGCRRGQMLVTLVTCWSSWKRIWGGNQLRTWYTVSEIQKAYFIIAITKRIINYNDFIWWFSTITGVSIRKSKMLWTLFL